MRGDWIGLAPTALGIVPISPSRPAWAQVALPERIVNQRTLIKDDKDEALSENDRHKEHRERGHDRVHLRHPFDSDGLRNPQTPLGGAGAAAARHLQWRNDGRKLSPVANW